MKFIVFLLCSLSVTLANAVTEFTVHHAPGGPSDKVTRIITKYLPENQYVVTNRPGAQGRIAVKHLMSTDSIMLSSMAQIYVNNQLLGVDYNPDKDLSVIANIGIMPSVLVCRSDMNLHSVPDLIKSNHLTFAVAGIGSSEHLATEVLFNRMNKRHLIVPYATGGGKSIMDILGKHVDCMFGNYPTLKEWVTDKRLSVIMTSHDLGLSVNTWESLYNEKFPFNASLAVVTGSQNSNKRIINDLEKVISNKRFIADLKEIGIFPTVGMSPKDINNVVKNNKLIKDVIIQNGIKLQ